MAKDADKHKTVAHPRSNFCSWDPLLSSKVPDKYHKAVMKSLYVPGSEGYYLFIAEQFTKELGNIKLNQAFMEGLKLWLERMLPEYLKKLLIRLENEEQELSQKIEKLAKKKKSSKFNTVNDRYTKVRIGKKKIKQKLEELRTSPQERYQHFFYSVLSNMAECGLDEMTDRVRSLEYEKLEEINKIEEGFEYGDHENGTIEYRSTAQVKRVKQRIKKSLGP